MKILKTVILPIILSTLWISISEFVRNEFLIKSHWISHFEKNGLIFPAEPVNGIIWGVWSLLFAVLIYLISKRFTIAGTMVISWLAGFLMMWVVAGNLGFLPYSILIYAVPLSLLETGVAVFIIRSLTGQQEK